MGDRGRGKEGIESARKLLANCFPQLLKSYEIVTKVEKAFLRKLNLIKEIVNVGCIPA